MEIRVLFIFFCLVQLASSQELVDFSMSSCSERSYPEYIKHRVVSRELKNDTLTIKVGLTLNCCIDPEIILSHSNDSLFFQVENVANSICACNCCFEIEMRVSGVSNIDLGVFYLREEFDDNANLFADAFLLVPHELKESSNKYVFPTLLELEAFKKYSGEMNQLTDDGQKIGLWKRESEKSSNIDYYLLYYSKGENDKSRIQWYASFDIEGELSEICGRGIDDHLNCADARDYYLLFGIDILKE